MDLGAEPPTAWGHLVDLIFFRLLGLALIANEVMGKGAADWHVLVAGFGAFFMPDWLRGRSSPVARAAIRAWVDGASSKLEDVRGSLDELDRDVSGGQDGEEDKS